MNEHILTVPMTAHDKLVQIIDVVMVNKKNHPQSLCRMSIFISILIIVLSKNKNIGNIVRVRTNIADEKASFLFKSFLSIEKCL